MCLHIEDFLSHLTYQAIQLKCEGVLYLFNLNKMQFNMIIRNCMVRSILKFLQ